MLRKVKSVKEKGDPEIESGSQKLKPESSHKKEKSKTRQDTNPDNHDQEKRYGNGNHFVTIRNRLRARIRIGDFIRALTMG